jgi:hypothetical protein
MRDKTKPPIDASDAIGSYNLFGDHDRLLSYCQQRYTSSLTKVDRLLKTPMPIVGLNHVFLQRLTYLSPLKIVLGIVQQDAL